MVSGFTLTTVPNIPEVVTTSSCFFSRLSISVWVGIDAQGMLTFDERYAIPAYTGHNGWILLDVEDTVDWEEVGELVDTSYRHFALKRMLNALGEV